MFDVLEKKEGWLNPIGGKFIGLANLEAIIERLEGFRDGIPEEYREQNVEFTHLRLINTIDESLRHINADLDTSFAFIALEERKEGEQQSDSPVTTQIDKQTPCRTTNELSATLSKLDSATRAEELELKELFTQQFSTSKSEDQSTDLTEQVNSLLEVPGTPLPELDNNSRPIEQHDEETGKRRRSRRRRRNWSWLSRHTPQAKLTFAIGITLFLITVFSLLPGRNDNAHVSPLSTSKTPESIAETTQKSSVATLQPSTASPSPQLRHFSRNPSQQTEPDVVWALYKEIKQTSFYQTGQGEKPEQWNRFIKLLTDKEEKGDHRSIALMSALRQQGKGVKLDQAAALRGYFLIMNDEKADSQLLTQVSRAAAELTLNAIEMHDSDTVRLLLPEIKKMAENKNPYWQMMVGEVYRLGVAGSPNPEEAAVWYEKAKAQSNDARIRQWAEQSLATVR